MSHLYSCIYEDCGAHFPYGYNLSGMSVDMMLPWIFTFCLLQTPVCLCLFSDSQCIRSMQHGLYHDGNVLIAGFVPLYSYHSNPRGNFEASEYYLIQYVWFKKLFLFIMQCLSALTAVLIQSNILCTSHLDFPLLLVTDLFFSTSSHSLSSPKGEERAFIFHIRCSAFFCSCSGLVFL